MQTGERQVSPTRDGIRRDHVARYEFAARLIGDSPHRVLDVACGVGYGSQLLAQRGHQVLGIDIDREAIRYARLYYSHPSVAFDVADMARLPAKMVAGHETAIAFECIEHVEDPRPALKALHEAGVRQLIASVPNEAEFPHGGAILFHHRHYTAAEFDALLLECGWHVNRWYGQAGPHSEVVPGGRGRTIVAVCANAPAALDPERPAPARKPAQKVAPMLAPSPPPRTVAILGLGPSLESYVDVAKRLGARSKLADQTWGINAVGDVVRCDLVFHMDDARVQERRAEAAPESNIAAMMGWMRDYDGRVLTSVPHPDYPCMEAYPLQDVVRSCSGFAYFNSTAAYAVAYAIHIGVEKIMLFGCDFTYQNSHHAEKGRACMEFWLGFAAARGIKIAASKLSSLLDACEPIEQRMYGYDGATVTITGHGDETEVNIARHDELPSAEEVEAAYDHSAHPNALVREEMGQ